MVFGWLLWEPMYLDVGGGGGRKGKQASRTKPDRGQGKMQKARSKRQRGGRSSLSTMPENEE